MLSNLFQSKFRLALGIIVEYRLVLILSIDQVLNFGALENFNMGITRKT